MKIPELFRFSATPRRRKRPEDMLQVPMSIPEPPGTAKAKPTTAGKPAR